VSYAQDLRTLMQRGDVDQMSFAFRVAKDEWDETDETNVIRTVIEFKELFDASIVTFPAYPQTDAQMRGQMVEVEYRTKAEQRRRGGHRGAQHRAEAAESDQCEPGEARRGRCAGFAGLCSPARRQPRTIRRLRSRPRHPPPARSRRKRERTDAGALRDLPLRGRAPLAAQGLEWRDRRAIRGLRRWRSRSRGGRDGSCSTPRARRRPFIPLAEQARARGRSRSTPGRCRKDLTT
jgi:hypothetical protein